MADDFNTKFEQMFGKKQTLVVPPIAQGPMSDEDAALAEFLKASQPKILVIGVGGSGSNTANRMMEVGVTGATIAAMNTDAQHLLRVKANKKLLLGRNRTRGLGAGSNPELGEQAASESIEEIKKLVAGSDLVFVTCGMGGGTGTGGAHLVAKAAKAQGAVVVGVCTLPFSSEGTKRMDHAIEGLEKLKHEADATIAIPNDKLLYYVPDLPLDAAFRASDAILTNAVKGITELITKPGLVNVDFADVRTLLEHSGYAMIGLGEVEDNAQKDRVLSAAEKALSSPLLDLDLSQANKALVNITGGKGLTLGEAEAAVNMIASKIAKNAHIKWGATIDEALGNKNVRVLALVAGVKDLIIVEGPPGKNGAPQTGVEDLEFVD